MFVFHSTLIYTYISYKIILQTDYKSLILSEQEPIIHCQSNVDRYVICNKKAGNVCQALFHLVLYPV